MQSDTTEVPGMEGMSFAPISDGNKADWEKSLSGLTGTAKADWKRNSRADCPDCR